MYETEVPGPTLTTSECAPSTMLPVAVVVVLGFATTIASELTQLDAKSNQLKYVLADGLGIEFTSRNPLTGLPYENRADARTGTDAVIATGPAEMVLNKNDCSAARMFVKLWVVPPGTVAVRLQPDPPYAGLMTSNAACGALPAFEK